MFLIQLGHIYATKANKKGKVKNLPVDPDNIIMNECLNTMFILVMVKEEEEALPNARLVLRNARIALQNARMVFRNARPVIMLSFRSVFFFHVKVNDIYYKRIYHTLNK